MNDMPFHMSVGSVEVRTTNNRGFTPEEVAEIIKNVSRPIAGIKQVQVWIDLNA